MMLAKFSLNNGSGYVLKPPNLILNKKLEPTSTNTTEDGLDAMSVPLIDEKITITIKVLEGRLLPRSPHSFVVNPASIAIRAHTKKLLGIDPKEHDHSGMSSNHLTARKKRNSNSAEKEKSNGGLKPYQHPEVKHQRASVFNLFGDRLVTLKHNNPGQKKESDETQMRDRRVTPNKKFSDNLTSKTLPLQQVSEIGKPETLEYTALKGFDKRCERYIDERPIREFIDAFKNESQGGNFSEPNPYVVVSVLGDPKDAKNFETPYLVNNGIKPEWTVNNEFTFTVDNPLQAFLYVELRHYDALMSDILASACVPLPYVGEGLRNVPLRDRSGKIIPRCTLIIDIKITQTPLRKASFPAVNERGLLRKFSKWSRRDSASDSIEGGELEGESVTKSNSATHSNSRQAFAGMIGVFESKRFFTMRRKKKEEKLGQTD